MPADFTGGDLRRIAHVHQVLIDSDSPAVRFYGLRNRLQFEQAAGRLSPDAFDRMLADARSAARAALDDRTLIAIDRNGFLRNHLYRDAMSLTDASQSVERRLADRLEWYDFMIARGEIAQLAVQFLSELPSINAPATEAVRLLKRLDERLESLNCRLIGFSAAEARTLLSEKTRYLGDIYPEVRAAFLSGKRQARILLQVGQNNVTAIEHVVSDDHGAYALVTATDERRQPVLQAMPLPLAVGDPVRPVGTVAGSFRVNDACLTDRWIVAATNGGIYLFPRAAGGGAPAKVTTEDGLPTDIVQSVAMDGDVIYAGLGDRGYLVSFDIITRRCTVLASSRRKQKASPFDDVSGFTIPRIVVDDARQRILFVHCHPGRFDENGLWQFEPARGAFRQLLKVYFDYGDQNAAATRLLRGRRMVINSANWAAWVDIDDDSRQILFADSIGMGRDHRANSPLFPFNEHVAAPFTLVGDDLWAGKPLCRMERGTNQVETIELPVAAAAAVAAFAGSDGSATRPSRSRASRPASTRAPRPAHRVDAAGRADCNWIEPLLNGEHVIVGNARGLWLISTTESKPATRSGTTTRLTPGGAGAGE
jgi:hypothetical protein